MAGRKRATFGPFGVLITLAFAAAGCRAPDPQLSFLDDESSVSFAHPPRWSVGFAEQDGLRYRYLTAPKVENDREALSVTLISPATAASSEAVAQAYLTGASEVSQARKTGSTVEWSFRDSSGVSSRLMVRAARDGRFFGAWARGPEAAMKRYSGRLDDLFASLTLEVAADWPEEKFGGMSARAPSNWSRGSRFSSATNAVMHLKSPPLAVDKGTETIHGFVTLTKEPVPPPGDLAAFQRMLADRASDTVVVVQHRPWTPTGHTREGDGYTEFLRSGTTLSDTRSRRWVMVQAGVGMTLACEARSDAFDRLEPWCERMAGTVRLE